MASAGTIINKDASDTIGNTNNATESLCPKGWSLPSSNQTNSQRNLASFLPVLGGGYSNGILYEPDTRGFWWSSTAYNGTKRYGLTHTSAPNLYNFDGTRYYGRYIRCVSEEKTVLDLTYMQDGF